MYRKMTTQEAVAEILAEQHIRELGLEEGEVKRLALKNRLPLSVQAGLMAAEEDRREAPDHG